MASTASTPPKSQSSSSSSNDNSTRRRRTRCKKCESCLRADCGECHFCKDMKKFGGPGRMKQSCISRQCMVPVLPHTACCMICGRDGWEKVSVTGLIGLDDTQSSLMECSQCWEIVHPVCLKEKDPSIDLESGKRDDLPNSWECPKCVIALKTASGKMKPIPKPFPVLGPKLDMAPIIIPNVLKPESKIHMISQPPENIDKQPSVVINVDHQPSPKDSVFPPTEISANTISIPSPEGSFSKVSDESSTDTATTVQPTSSVDNGESKPNTVGTTSVGFKKRPAESLKDRLFRSLKIFKKNSGGKYTLPKRFTNLSSPSFKRTDQDSGNSSPSSGVGVSTTLTPVPTLVKEKDEENSENVAPARLDESKSESPSKMIDEDDETDKEETDETNDLTDNESTPTTPNNFHSSEIVSLNGRPIVKPLYVVRPCPIPDDYSESDAGEDDEEDSEEDSSEDDEVAERRRERKRIIRKHLRKFRRPKNANLALERDVIFHSLKFLDREDILNCSLVCKSWSAWCTDPSLWPSLNYSGKRITPAILTGIVRRQPRVLDLSWTNISHKQMQWLLPRVPQLQTLKLSGCSASTVSALCTSNCPLLKSLDVSFVDAFDDDLVRDLTASPSDQRPGLLDTRTRLRQLQEISVAGADTTDIGFRVLIANFPLLARIDFSNCSRLSDISISYLTGSSKAIRITSLQLYGCEALTDDCLTSLEMCENLVHLDMRCCDRVTVPAFAKFFRHQLQRGHALMFKDSKLFIPRSS